MSGTLEFVIQTARGVMASLALSYEVETGVNVNEEELACMAENIYFEGRAEPMVGKIAIGHVVLNRIEDSRFPNTICEVVKQGPHRPSWKGTGEMIPIRHKCQFSWYCDGKSDKIYDTETFESIYQLTEGVVSGTMDILDITEGATHYHADYVSPAWKKSKTKTTEIGDHIFYRWEK